MRLDVRVIGDLPGFLQEEVLRGEQAVSGAMTATASGLQRDWRGQIVGSGLGTRLANAVRKRVFPESEPSLNAAGLVFAQPNKNGDASAAEVLETFDKGALIRSERGFWLAVPIDPLAKKMRGPGNTRITPGRYEQRTGLRLDMVFRKGRLPLLVTTGRSARNLNDKVSFNQSKRRRKAVWTPIFVLVPQVRLGSRLNLDEATAIWLDKLPGSILSRWKEVKR